MTHSKADVVVIGAGPGGLEVVFDLVASVPHFRIVLIEKRELGGDNLWSGTLFSKKFLHLAKNYNAGDRMYTADKVLQTARKRLDDFASDYDELELQRQGVVARKSPLAVRCWVAKLRCSMSMRNYSPF